MDLVTVPILFFGRNQMCPSAGGNYEGRFIACLTLNFSHWGCNKGWVGTEVAF